MKCCEDCIYFVYESCYHLFYDGYCTLLRTYNGDHKGVRRSNSCDRFFEAATKSNSNFNGGGCFLTSACTEYLGKPDDCRELTKLRAFRDSYMKATEYGRNLVKEYYSVAPEIVNKINASENKNKYYKDIYKTILLCITEIDRHNNEKALNLYKQMVDKYKKEFSI